MTKPYDDTCTQTMEQFCLYGLLRSTDKQVLVVWSHQQEKRVQHVINMQYVLRGDRCGCSQASDNTTGSSLRTVASTASLDGPISPSRYRRDLTPGAEKVAASSQLTRPMAEAACLPFDAWLEFWREDASLLSSRSRSSSKRLCSCLMTHVMMVTRPSLQIYRRLMCMLRLCLYGSSATPVAAVAGDRAPSNDGGSRTAQSSGAFHVVACVRYVRSRDGAMRHRAMCVQEGGNQIHNSGRQGGWCRILSVDRRPYSTNVDGFNAKQAPRHT